MTNTSTFKEIMTKLFQSIEDAYAYAWPHLNIIEELQVEDTEWGVSITLPKDPPELMINDLIAAFALKSTELQDRGIIISVNENDQARQVIQQQRKN